MTVRGASRRGTPSRAILEQRAGHAGSAGSANETNGAAGTSETAETVGPGPTVAPAFDGVFCSNDYAAFVVIRGLADYGIDIPGDVKVIGFDDATSGAYTTPTLSTIQVDLDQLARFALDMITRRVEQRSQGATGTPATRATIGYALVARESTAVSAQRTIFFRS